MTHTDPANAVVEVPQAPEAAANEAPADAPADPQPGLSVWTDALLATARHLGLPTSPEMVRNAAAWSGEVAREQAIADIARAASLDVNFVDLRIETLSPVLLPVLVELDAKTVGVVIGISADRATLLLPSGGEVIERSVAIETLGDAHPVRVLMAHGIARRHDGRLDAYMAPAPHSWLYNVFSSHWATIWELGAGSLVGNLLAIATSLFSMQVWDRVVPARSTNTLWVLASGVGIALLLEFLIRTARVSLADHFGKRADLKLSAMFFSHVLAIRNDARPRSPGTLVAQLRDLEQIRELLTSSVLGVLLDLPFVLVFLGIIWMLGGVLAVMPLLAIPLIVGPGLLIQIPLGNLSRKGVGEAALRNAVLMESIYRIEDIKALQAEPRFRHLWDGVNRASGEVSLRQRFLAGVLVNYSQMVQQLAYVGVIILGAYAILAGELSFGAVLACSILTSRTIAPLAQVAAVLGRLQSARVGKKALDEMLRLPVDHQDKDDAYHRPALIGQYRFEDVVYAFDPESKPAIEISRLNIKPGERIAILGRVGAGKSTLLRLAGGLATPVQGRIALDGTPMNLIDIADVRRDIGVAMQESNLFYGTIRENLLIANPLATEEAIQKAMHMACADQLLLNQPHGLDFKVRENGVGLSGGQRQALVLARTFLRAPNILLLDEPTASLDEATEATIIERLGQWLGNRTLIVATHRYSVLSLVDRILVIDGGRVVLDGAKAEILQRLRGQSNASASPKAPAVRGAQFSAGIYAKP